ncbi:MAG: hypothetical protein P1U63_08045 [Coxiellaceae bacterium]|nr:hypothetical protein [Coxiellaceae bacterium]
MGRIVHHSLPRHIGESKESAGEYSEIIDKSEPTPMHAHAGFNAFLCNLPKVTHQQLFITTAWAAMLLSVGTLLSATLPYTGEYKPAELPTSENIGEAIHHLANKDMQTIVSMLSTITFMGVFVVGRLMCFGVLRANGDAKTPMPCVTAELKQVSHKGLLRHATPVIVAARATIAIAMGMVMPIMYSSMDVPTAIKNAKSNCAPLFNNPQQAMKCAQSFFEKHCAPFRQTWWTVFAVSAAVLVLDVALLYCQRSDCKKPLLDEQALYDAESHEYRPYTQL